MILLLQEPASPAYFIDTPNLNTQKDRDSLGCPGFHFTSAPKSP